MFRPYSRASGVPAGTHSGAGEGRRAAARRRRARGHLRGERGHDRPPVGREPATAQAAGAGDDKIGERAQESDPDSTYTLWDEEMPGFLEIDMIAHGGLSRERICLYPM